jgi:uncharacterized membrane protein YgdD (TMEM256/DUF423 family)
MANPWWTVAGVVGALGVGLGAFGAHGLETALAEHPEGPRLLEVWGTAGRYHLVHALALLGVAAHPRRPAVVGGLFLGGIALFAGSLYLMPVLTLAVGGSWRWLGAITPLGGVCFIAGWLALAAWPRRAPREDAPCAPGDNG